MRKSSMRHLLAIATTFVMLVVVVGCDTGQVTPVPTPVPPEPSATPPPMAGKLILYGDLAFFAGQGKPDNCILKSRYRKGEGVGFRMTAIDPLSGKFVETAELVVQITYAGKTVDVPMRYRGTGANPRPGFWTGKWVVPEDAPVGVVKYKVTAKDDQGRTGEFQPFQIESSELTIVD